MLKKRSTAIIIVTVAAIVCSLIGVRISINREAHKVEDLFYSGVGSETAIQTYLDNAFKEAKTICSTASQHLGNEQAAGFRAAYNALYDAKTIGEKYTCNETLKSELADLLEQLDGASLTEDEQEYLQKHVDAMYNIQRMIETSSYNGEVERFNSRVLGSFPANVLRYILHPDTPELFI